MKIYTENRCYHCVMVYMTTFWRCHKTVQCWYTVTMATEDTSVNYRPLQSNLNTIHYLLIKTLTQIHTKTIQQITYIQSMSTYLVFCHLFIIPTSIIPAQHEMATTNLYTSMTNSHMATSWFQKIHTRLTTIKTIFSITECHIQL